MKRILALSAWLLALGMPSASHADQEPAACVQEIERVCKGLEDRLEGCLADRGDQMSAACRDELKTAMGAVQDPSGPGSCIPDVQRLCPNLKPRALAKCISEKQSSFS